MKTQYGLYHVGNRKHFRYSDFGILSPDYGYSIGTNHNHEKSELYLVDNIDDILCTLQGKDCGEKERPHFGCMVESVAVAKYENGILVDKKFMEYEAINNAYKNQQIEKMKWEQQFLKNRSDRLKPALLKLVREYKKNPNHEKIEDSAITLLTYVGEMTLTREEREEIKEIES